MEQEVPWWGHACVLHPCSPASRSWVAFCLTVGDSWPEELVHMSPRFSTVGSSGVSAPSLTFHKVRLCQGQAWLSPRWRFSSSLGHLLRSDYPYEIFSSV